MELEKTTIADIANEIARLRNDYIANFASLSKQMHESEQHTYVYLKDAFREFLEELHFRFEELLGDLHSFRDTITRKICERRSEDRERNKSQE